MKLFWLMGLRGPSLGELTHGSYNFGTEVPIPVFNRAVMLCELFRRMMNSVVSLLRLFVLGFDCWIFFVGNWISFVGFVFLGTILFWGSLLSTKVSKLVRLTRALIGSASMSFTGFWYTVTRFYFWACYICQRYVPLSALADCNRPRLCWRTLITVLSIWLLDMLTSRDCMRLFWATLDWGIFFESI